MPYEKNWFHGFSLVKTIREKRLRGDSKRLLHQQSLMKFGVPLLGQTGRCLWSRLGLMMAGP